MSEDNQSKMQIEVEQIDSSKSKPKSKTKQTKSTKFPKQTKPKSSPKKPILEQKFETSNKIYIVPNRLDTIPIDLKYAALFNQPIEIKSIGGLCLEILTHFIGVYSNPLNEQSGANVLTEFRHHLATAVIAYLRAASYTTVLPGDMASTLNYYAHKNIYIDPNLVKVFNAFMPIHKAVQLNVVDICYKANVIFDALQPLYNCITRGTIIQGQTAVEYNSIMALTDHNPIIKAIRLAHQSTAFATYMTTEQIQQSILSKIGNEYQFQTIIEAKLPVFIFDFDPDRSKFKTRKQYSIVVRSTDYITINDSNCMGVRSFTNLPPRESDTIIRVNSTYQYIHGFHISEIASGGFCDVRYQNRNVVQQVPQQPVVTTTNYEGMTPQPNYEQLNPKVDTRIHSCSVVFYSEEDHGKRTTRWFKLSIPTKLLDTYRRGGRVHVTASNAIQTIDPTLDLTRVEDVQAVEQFNSAPFSVYLDDVTELRQTWVNSH